MSRQALVEIDHGIAAQLELLAGLLHCVSRTEWAWEEWLQKLRCLESRRARVVILHLLHGFGFKEIGERLGVSRGRVDQLWRSSLRKLQHHLKEELP